MENENQGFDVDEFYDEGVEQAGIDVESEQAETTEQVEQTEQTQTETANAEAEVVDSALKATEKEAEETETTPESSISQLLETPGQEPDDAAGDSRTVPLDQHIKLRQRAQAAEAKVEELVKGQKTTRPSGENDETTDLPQVVDEDGYVDSDKIAEAIAKVRSDTKAEVQAEFQQRAAIENAKAITQKSLASEKEVRKANTDYDQVTKAALQFNLLTDEDRQKIFAGENPAQTYYETAKQKVNALRQMLGISTNSNSDTSESQTETEVAETVSEEQPYESDEEAFNDIFGTDEAA